MIRDGASFNEFRRTKMENTNSGIIFSDSVEDGDTLPGATGHPGNNNIIDSSAINNSYIGVNFSDYSVQSDAGSNTISNTRFHKTRYIHYVARHATQMQYINNT